MLYVIIDKGGKEPVMLVKANDSDEVEARLKLSETQEIAGSFTSHETDVLASASFVVIVG